MEHGVCNLNGFVLDCQKGVGEIDNPGFLTCKALASSPASDYLNHSNSLLVTDS